MVILGSSCNVHHGLLETIMIHGVGIYANIWGIWYIDGKAYHI